MGSLGWRHRLTVRAGVFLVFLILMGLNPGHIYQNCTTGFVLFGFFGVGWGPSISLWRTLKGALPIDRKAWLWGELIRALTDGTVLYAILALGVAWLRGGADGWSSFWGSYGGILLACLVIPPWAVVGNLNRTGLDWFFVKILVFVSLGSGATAFLGVTLHNFWQNQQYPWLVTTTLGAWALSWTGAWLTARHMIFKGGE